MNNSSVFVGQPAPSFDLPSALTGEAAGARARLNHYRGRWLLLIFYPRDFSQVCPTELTAVSDKLEAFRDRNCAVLGIGTDSIESHARWLKMPRDQGGLAGLTFPPNSTSLVACAFEVEE